MIDRVEVTIKAGSGGDGAVSFHREKFVTKGGPDGGDGGKGGSVFLIADNNTSTLDDFKSKKVFGAQNGQAGKKLNMHGGDAEDLMIKVPVGTLVFEIDRGERRLIADLNTPHISFMVAKGGRGGIGNARFKSSTNQAPCQYIPGEVGEQKEVILELKLIADIGLLGLPSVGKSTLINTLTHINAKVAEYHFTTLTPNLGVWEIDQGRRVVVADIPGLIEGASSGKGLGDEFLRHVERTKVLIHIVDPLVDGDLEIDLDKVFQSYQVILKELEQYKTGLWSLSGKPQIVVLNKIDITEVKESLEEIIDYFNQQGVDVLPISAATGEGVGELRKRVLTILSQSSGLENKVEPVIKRYSIFNLPGLNRREVLTKVVKGVIPSGKKIRKLPSVRQR